MPVTEELQAPPVPEVAASSRPSYWTREPSAIYALLSVIAVVPYLNTLMNGFVDDDTLQVLANPFIQHPGHLRQIFTADAWAFYGASALSDFYRPLMNLTYLVLWRIYGAVPVGYHIANLVLEAGVVCMVYAVTMRWTRDRGIAFLSAVIFALHPIHAESVEWIADVTDLESTLFLLLSFWLLLSLPGRRRRRWLCSAGMALCLGLALLAKEAAIVFPAVATAFEYGYRRDYNEVRPIAKLKRVIPLWLVAGAYLALRQRMLGGLVSIDTKPNAGMLETVSTGFSLFGHYVEKLFWPVNLIFTYRIPHPHGAASLALWAGVALASLAIALIPLLRKKYPVISFGLVWLLMMLSLSLNIHWLGMGEFADRYVYAPSLGFAWIMAWCGMAVWMPAVVELVARTFGKATPQWPEPGRGRGSGRGGASRPDRPPSKRRRPGRHRRLPVHARESRSASNSATNIAAAISCRSFDRNTHHSGQPRPPLDDRTQPDRGAGEDLPGRKPARGRQSVHRRVLGDGHSPGPAGQALDVRFTYDLNGVLEVEATIVETSQDVHATSSRSHARGLNQSRSPARSRRWKSSRPHPREETANRFLLQRAERVYQRADAGSPRTPGPLLDGFEAALGMGDRDAIDVIA